MKGDLHIFIDFDPKYPDHKVSFVAEGFRETGRISYASTPVMEREYRLRIYLKEPNDKNQIIDTLMKDCRGTW
jgi:hypothetical protein